MNPKYTCTGSGSLDRVAEISWSGVPKNSGVGHPVLQANSRQCIKSQSFAIVVEDLDYPYGNGQSGNHIHTHFWAANIPGDWTSFNMKNAATAIHGEKIVTIGKNDKGTIGFDPVCPEYGVHRIRVTLWAMSEHLGDEVDPLSPESTWAEVRAKLEPIELARSAFYTTMKAVGWKAAHLG